jgi:WD40 repeat protein
VLVTPAPVASLSFNPSGDIFATTGGSDGTAKLWRTETRQQLGTGFEPDPGQWGTAAFTPDGRYLVVLYDDGSGFLWPTALDAWEEHACKVAGRNLTREEWRRFVGSRPYRSICTAFSSG